MACCLHHKIRFFYYYFSDEKFLRSTYWKHLEANGVIIPRFCFGVLRAQHVMGNRKREMSLKVARDERAIPVRKAGPD